jgi:CheY-like chemotaxis protein
MTRILLVDDAEIMLGLERTFLKRTGCEVLIAASGEEALDKVRRHRPDLVVLDANMHGMDGLACCREIKGDPASRDLPVVFVSSALDHERCLAAGGDGFVAKPVTQLRLIDAVRKFLPVSERKEDRVSVTVKVEYSHASGSGLGFTRDVSPAGLFLKSRDEFHVGEAVDLSFVLPVSGSRSLHAGAEVIRAVAAIADSPAAAGAGVAFRRLSARDHLEISRFVREHAGGRA